MRGSPPEIRLAARQARSKPIIEELKRWLEQTLKTLSTKSDMAGAIRYALSRWVALTRYLDDGTVEIDNNAAERAAAIYPLLGTAKLNGINPEHYLRYVLTHIAEHPIHRIAEFLPWNIQTTLTSEITTDA